MSTYQSVRLACRACGLEQPLRYALTINLGRHPALEEEILAGTLNRLRCVECAEITEFDEPVAVIDFARRWWLTCFPKRELVHYRALAVAVRHDFVQNILAGPERVHPLLEDPWQVRLVFGLDALREKLLVWRSGIDEAALEALKLALVQSEPARAFAPIMLQSAQDDQLELRASDGVIVLPRNLLSAPPPSRFNRDELLCDPFVSYQRWLIVSEPLSSMSSASTILATPRSSAPSRLRDQ